MLYGVSRSIKTSVDQEVKREEADNTVLLKEDYDSSYEEMDLDRIKGMQINTTNEARLAFDNSEDW